MSNIIKFPESITISSSPLEGVAIKKTGFGEIKFNCDETFFIVLDALMALSPTQLAVVCQRASMFMVSCHDDENGTQIYLYNEYMDSI